MRKICILILVVLVIQVSPSHAGKYGQESYGPPVDIVFCLDLSGSTNGILPRMRDHIWDYVEVFRNCNPKVDFRIGFVGFARPSFGKENYYIKVISDLTHDIEGLTNELLKLRPQIEAGDQFVGQALRVCANNISWNERPDAIKIIFLGGNGLVETGGEHYSKPVHDCVEKGIIINSIFLLNNPMMGEQAGWENIAKLGNGKYTSMNLKYQYYENLHGFDIEKLFSLNRKLNETYLYHGPTGKDRWKMQRAVDESIYKANTEGYRYRIQFRISYLYLNKNSSWDLVDLNEKNPEAIGTIDKNTLPDTLKFGKESDIRASIEFATMKRKETVIAITKLLEEKERLVAEKNLEAEKTMKTFDITTINWLKEILAARGYSFKIR